jgi:mono/diheme cytochrome c family protein
MWTVGVSTLLAGCAAANEPKTSKTADEPLQITAGTRISTEGILSYGAVVFAENPTTLLEAQDFHGYELDGKAGGNITIKMNASSCGLPDTVLDLFGPEDANGNRAFLIENDDANLSPCPFDSQITSFTLPVTGRYLIVGTSFLQQGGNGHYRLQVTCNNNACVDPAAPTLAGSQIAQTDIDQGLFSPAQLFDIGDFTFEHVFRIEEGVGNALKRLPAGNQPRPNFRNVEFGAFGGPEAQSCVTCHNVGGDNGAGDLNHNIFQNSDGINRSSGLPRNPPGVLGNGFRQAIGAEMTIDLLTELATAKAQAAVTGVAVTKALSSKGISFGSVIANPDFTVNFAGVVGVDSDLVVKPFGWKGREAKLRRFVDGEFRTHLGIQSAPSIALHCLTPNVNTFGNGSDCTDPDGDGVRDEITEGLLSAEAVYMGLLETPVRVPAVTPAAQTRANSGEALFNQIGCGSCHTPTMILNSPIHVEPADTTGGAGITLNLATDSKDPHPAINNGSIAVELWSDFKRHRVGAALADSKNFNQIAADQFITPPLWGVADSAPYLHDGRAATLNDAILAHAGDAQAVRNAYAALAADQQLQIQEFLGTLGRQEDRDARATPVDLSGFILEQTGSLIDAVLPTGTKVPHGGFLIVARNATQAQFETFYGEALGTNVTFLTGGDTFPVIDGGEAFALFDLQGVFVDGRSFAEAATGQQTLQRTSCGAAAPLAASWNIAVTSTAGATPGRGPLSTGQNRICVSEVADATNPSFEFVEIFVE